MHDGHAATPVSTRNTMAPRMSISTTKNAMDSHAATSPKRRGAWDLRGGIGEVSTLCDVTGATTCGGLKTAARI